MLSGSKINSKIRGSGINLNKTADNKIENLQNEESKLDLEIQAVQENIKSLNKESYLTKRDIIGNEITKDKMVITINAPPGSILEVYEPVFENNYKYQIFIKSVDKVKVLFLDSNLNSSNIKDYELKFSQQPSIPLDPDYFFDHLQNEGISDFYNENETFDNNLFD
jgi:hypothetical protein